MHNHTANSLTPKQKALLKLLLDQPLQIGRQIGAAASGLPSLARLINAPVGFEGQAQAQPPSPVSRRATQGMAKMLGRFARLTQAQQHMPGKALIIGVTRSSGLRMLQRFPGSGVIATLGLQPGKAPSAQPAKVASQEPAMESTPLASVTIPPAVQAQSGSVRIYRGQRVYA